MRAQPPGFAGSGPRRQTFTTALEQAEQLLRTAAQMGPETRPINLFYGLSQGARAVAAALEPDSRAWRPYGHGIDKVGSLDRVITTIQVQDKGEKNGSFARMASLLRSPTLPDPVELGDLLAALPLRVPSSSWTDRPRAVIVNNIAQSDGAVLTLSPHIFAATHGWPLLDGIRDKPVEERREQLRMYIDAHYPTLQGFEPMPEGHVQLIVHEDQMQFTAQLTAESSIGAEAVREQVLYMRTTDVAGQQFAIPVFAGAVAPCHPTVTLWASLWAMSMLARYEPVRWAKALNVDSSADATALEEVLEDALTMVPWALVDALSKA